jgi:hypothetical protein
MHHNSPNIPRFACDPPSQGPLLPPVMAPLRAFYKPMAKVPESCETLPPGSPLSLCHLATRYPEGR